MREHHGERPDAIEQRDANSKSVVLAIIGLIAMTVIFVVGVAVLFGWFGTSIERARHAPPIPPESMLPPAPRLESVPGELRREIRERSRKALESYGWVNQKEGIVRIPIERAMDIVAQRELPHRPSAAAKPGGEQ